MSDAEYFHTIEIDEAAKLIKIHRVFPDGEKQLYTEMALPPDLTATFAQRLGESILLDSPAGRRLLGV
jgi:hypothetical protein